MKLLAVETATEACSAALYVEGEIKQKYQLAPREHTKLILPMIDALLAEASLIPRDLDALAFGRGPGSFTGVRIATGIIQGIAFGADLPVVPVSTLAAIAQDCFHNTDAEQAFTAMDARMGEVYWAVYKKNSNGSAELTGKEFVGPVAQITCPMFPGFGVGSAWKAYETELSNHIRLQLLGYNADYLPKAYYVAYLGAEGFKQGDAVPVEQAMPVYLRDKVAKKEAERQ